MPIIIPITIPATNIDPAKLWVGKVPSSQKYQEWFFSLSMSIGGIVFGAVLTTINVVNPVSYTIPNHLGGVGYSPMTGMI